MASSAPTYPAYNPAAVPTTMDEKIIAAPGPAPSAFTPYLDAIHSLHRPLTNPLVNTYSKFESWKSGFGLYQPGTVENLTREIKRTSYSPSGPDRCQSHPWPRPLVYTFLLTETHLTNFLFDGARADLTKGLSLSPAFQVTHSFALASATQPPSYNFGAVFADNNVGRELVVGLLKNWQGG